MKTAGVSISIKGLLISCCLLFIGLTSSAILLTIVSHLVCSFVAIAEASLLCVFGIRYMPGLMWAVLTEEYTSARYTSL